MIRILIFTLFISILGNAQKVKIDDSTTISLLTVESGKNLYDAFGHTAIRIKTKKIDRVYNYGFYDFNTPNFYLKFARGKLLYNLEAYPFHYFLRSYINENRSVTEQTLNLNESQKKTIFNFLENNALPKNKSYKYDFFFDNCATRPRDIINNNTKYSINKNSSPFTFRELIHQNLNNHLWGKFGIDLALGSVIDRKATKHEIAFLPEYLQKQINLRKTNNINLVKTEKQLFTSKKNKNPNVSKLTPIITFTLLFLLISIFTFKDYKRKKITILLDFALHLITGLIGLLIVFLWFFTDHKATYNNFNLLWAFFPNLFFAFYILKTKNSKKTKNYYILLITLIIITVIIWIVKLQVFNIAIIPILLLLLSRYTLHLLLIVKKS